MTPPAEPTPMNDTAIRLVAAALCDSSSHVNTLPHAEQRPCDYHRGRAASIISLLRSRGYSVQPITPAPNGRLGNPVPFTFDDASNSGGKR